MLNLRPAPPLAIAVVTCTLGAIGCGSNGSPSSAGGKQSPGTSSSSPPGSGGGAAQVAVAGGSAGPSGMLTNPVTACVDQGAAGFQVTIRGTLSGTSYVLKFDAPGGTTDLSVPTSADIVVYFAQLPAGANWGADPRAHKGSGTLSVRGSSGGQVAVHLIPGPGATTAGPVDVSGTYVCSSSLTG